MTLTLQPALNSSVFFFLLWLCYEWLFLLFHFLNYHVPFYPSSAFYAPFLHSIKDCACSELRQVAGPNTLIDSILLKQALCKMSENINSTFQKFTDSGNVRSLSLILSVEKKPSLTMNTKWYWSNSSARRRVEERTVEQTGAILFDFRRHNQAWQASFSPRMCGEEGSTVNVPRRHRAITLNRWVLGCKANLECSFRNPDCHAN